MNHVQRQKFAGLWLLTPALLLAGCPAARQAPPATQPAGQQQAGDHAGVLPCQQCHPTAWRVWVASRHARATIALNTGLARVFAVRAGMPEMMGYQETTSCLVCHGVGVTREHKPAPAGMYHPEEGVTCEACHGPAGQHVAAAQRKEARPALTRGLRTKPRPCLDCHQPKPSHDHEMRVPFDEQRFSAMIQHGKEPAGGSPEAATPDGAPTQPGAGM